MFVHKNHAAGGENGSIMVGMFVFLCFASYMSQKLLVRKILLADLLSPKPQPTTKKNSRFRAVVLLRTLCHRWTNHPEKARFTYYQEKILIPGINLQRKKYCNFAIAAGT